MLLDAKSMIDEGGPDFYYLVYKMFDFLGKNERLPNNLDDWIKNGSDTATSKLGERDFKALELRGELEKSLNNIDPRENWMLLRTNDRYNSYDLSLVFLNHFALRKKEGGNRELGFDFIKNYIKSSAREIIPHFPCTNVLSLKPGRRYCRQLVTMKDDYLHSHEINEVFVGNAIFDCNAVNFMKYRNQERLAHLINLDKSVFVGCQGIVDKSKIYREIGVHILV